MSRALCNAYQLSVIGSALIEDGCAEIARRFAEVLAKGECRQLVLATPYQVFAQTHSHLYRLTTEGRLLRERLPAGVDPRAAAPITQAVGDQNLARTVWALPRA